MNKDAHINTAVYSLWFGLNYGSILTSAALYKALEQRGYDPAFVQKPPVLWTERYADKNNIAGSFIYKYCNVLEVFQNESDNRILHEKIKNYVIGSDVVWNYNVIGKQAGLFYFLNDIPPKDCRKIAYASCFGGSFSAEGSYRNECGRLLRHLNGIAVKENREADILRSVSGVDPQIVVDPVFLCDKQFYIDCAENSEAKRTAHNRSFIFSYIECCDKLKRRFFLRGNDILSSKKYYELRNFVDINRFEESKQLLKLETAVHHNVEDWLFYLINSDFVITDTYYGMLFALIFEKNFVVLANKDLPDLYRYYDILRPLGLEERMVILQSDLKKKEYLFRKPIKYRNVNKKLNEMKSDSENYINAQLLKEHAECEQVEEK